MRKKILIVLGALLGVVVIFGVVVAMQPNDFKVERTATMNAPADVVFAQINDFHNWEEWSPWAKLDPNAKNTFEGPSQGEGAAFAWDGNDKIGAGKMTILESKPNELIRMKLEFTRPMQDESKTDFTFLENDGKTTVNWKMYGDHTFISKGMCMFMDMDTMVGTSFDEGLASIKKIVESKP